MHDGRSASSVRQYFMPAVGGGYNMFSSFSLQTLNLARDGEWQKDGGCSAGNKVACVTGRSG